MAAASQTFGAAVARAREAEGVSDPFSPSVPLTWRYGVLRYADEPQAYRPMRLRERLRRWWYDTLKQPRTSADPRRVFNDERGEYPSFAEARANCRTRNCYVMAMPFGQVPLGEELFDNPTFCRPLLEPEKAERLATLYAGADLRASVCAALWEENEALRGAQREMERRLKMLAGDA